MKALGALVILCSHLVLGQDVSQSDVPANFPEIGFSMNALYHSLGLKLGHVLSVRRERPVLSTFEGEMMLGFGTSPGNVADRQCAQAVIQQGTSTRRSNQFDQQRQDELNQRAAQECALFVNPWRFSFLNRATFEELQIIKDQPVLIYYVNYYFTPMHWLMRTKNQVLDAFPVQPDLRLNPNFRIPSWSSVQPEAGTITGRIVQASLEYPVRKTYEVIVQESENANNFRALSVNNGDLFRYITQAMLSGRQVRIEYVRLYSPHASLLTTLFNYMTNQRVISVDLL